MAQQPIITSLTAAQQGEFAAVRDSWLAVGLSTAPAERARAQAGVAAAYQAAGLAAPSLWIWLGSPYAGAMGASLLPTTGRGAGRGSGREAGREAGRGAGRGAGLDSGLDSGLGSCLGAGRGAGLDSGRGAGLDSGRGSGPGSGQVRGQVQDQVEDQVGAQVWAQVGDQVWAQVRDQVRDQVWDQVEAQVGAQAGDQVWAQVRAQVAAQVGEQVRAQVGEQVREQVWAQAGDQVWAQVRDQVAAQVAAQVGEQVRAQVRAQVGRCEFGQHSSGWLAFYSYFDRVLQLPCVGSLTGLMEVAQSCGWWWPFAHAVILTERPSALHRDAEHRLHHATEAAIRYPDGWGFYVWHGVRVPARYYEESLSAKGLLAEPNAEVRRALMERYDELHGKGSFIEDVGASVIDTAIQPMRAGEPDSLNELLRIDLGDDPEGCMVALRVIDPGTGRRYIIRVPPDQTTVQGALAWSFQVAAAADYILEAES